MCCAAEYWTTSNMHMLRKRVDETYFRCQGCWSDLSACVLACQEGNEVKDSFEQAEKRLLGLVDKVESSLDTVEEGKQVLLSTCERELTNITETHAKTREQERDRQWQPVGK